MLAPMHRTTLPLLLALLSACSCAEAPVPTVDLRSDALTNRTPYVPPQCYTKTRDEDGRVHNPCYVCHQASVPPNYADDADLQLAYDFSPPAQVNPWTNLFVDRREAIAGIDDEEILSWVRRSNYLDGNGEPILAKKLEHPPAAWDVNDNGRWDGWTPDVAFRFDKRGFDRTVDGSYTGWRAYSYAPFPGTFWPTNGSFGDALIRLPPAFRESAGGTFDRGIYEVNLAIAESLAARHDVEIAATDERPLGEDLDGDGRLGEARTVRFRWVPGREEMHWVGRAGAMQKRGELHLSAGLFPEGTELAHSVRYLDVREGKVTPSARMKELRYMVKPGWLSWGKLELNASRDAREKEFSANKPRTFAGNAETGIGNRAGWRMQAFIEDAKGELRPQSREEHAFCIGCHSGIGATTDSTFSFARKVPGERGWSSQTLEGMAEPIRGDGLAEYAHYLAENGATDEFRANPVPHRGSVEELLLPSPDRALALDKAYLLIVREQSFVRGRDAVLAPLGTVHRSLPESEEPVATGIDKPIPGPWWRPSAG